MKMFLEAATSHPWAMLPSRLEAIVKTALTISSFNGLKSRQPPKEEKRGKVAVLPLKGPIQQQSDIFTLLFGGTSTVRFEQMYRQVMESDEFESVIVDIDTPGGSVVGVQELSDVIYSYRGTKPVTGVVTGDMASAGLHIGSAFDEVVIQPSAMAGSLGVFTMHVDYSEAMKDDGVKVTFISAGKHKVEGNPYEPISKETVEFEQGLVDHFYDGFVADVARNRDQSEKDVKANFGQGRMLTAQQAVDVGMVDRVATMNEVIAQHTAPKRGTLTRTEAKKRLDALAR